MILTGMDKTMPALLTCNAHGEYAGWIMKVGDRDIASECPICAKRDHDIMLANITKTILVNQSRTAFTSSCIPARFTDKSFRDYEAICPAAAKVKTILQKYVNNFPKALENGTSFLFSGGTGTGKTHLACAVANNVMLLGHTAMYISSLNYLSKIKIAWATESGQSEDSLIESFVKPDLLVFDEIGKGELDRKEKAMIFRLLDRRYEDRKPTIGLSKYNEAKICQLIDDDAVRRLKCGGGGTLLFDWKNFQDSEAEF